MAKIGSRLHLNDRLMTKEVSSQPAINTKCGVDSFERFSVLEDTFSCTRGFRIRREESFQPKMCPMIFLYNIGCV